VLARLELVGFDSWSCFIGTVQGYEHSVQRNWQHCMIPETAFFGVRSNVVNLRFDGCISSLCGGLRLFERKS
jgi:hypothetical protein